MKFEFLCRLRNLFNHSESTESVMTVTPDGVKGWRNDRRLTHEGFAAIQKHGEPAVPAPARA
jgi:hypothetical protein